jgi:hypothetical protein
LDVEGFEYTGGNEGQPVERGPLRSPYADESTARSEAAQIVYEEARAAGYPDGYARMLSQYMQAIPLKKHPYRRGATPKIQGPAEVQEALETMLNEYVGPGPKPERVKAPSQRTILDLMKRWWKDTGHPPVTDQGVDPEFFSMCAGAGFKPPHVSDIMRSGSRRSKKSKRPQALSKTKHPPKGTKAYYAWMHEVYGSKKKSKLRRNGSGMKSGTGKGSFSIATGRYSASDVVALKKLLHQYSQPESFAITLAEKGVTPAELRETLEFEKTGVSSKPAAARRARVKKNGYRRNGFMTDLGSTLKSGAVVSAGLVGHALATSFLVAFAEKQVYPSTTPAQTVETFRMVAVPVAGFALFGLGYAAVSSLLPKSKMEIGSGMVASTIAMTAAAVWFYTNRSATPVQPNVLPVTK